MEEQIFNNPEQTGKKWYFTIMENSIVIGGGCFWCTEAVFQRLKGVIAVSSGYAGGHTDNPDYKSICTGMTGHAEVIKIDYKAEEISLEQLLEFFFIFHDPTTLNRQGNDVGTQYRSVIYYANDTEKTIAREAIDKASALYDDPILTELSELPKFFPAEEYHQNYYNQNSNKGYCAFTISPKVAKLRSKYSSFLKE